jgi:hypothetical protein
LLICTFANLLLRSVGNFKTLRLGGRQGHGIHTARRSNWSRG